MPRPVQRIAYAALGLTTISLAAGLWLWDRGLSRPEPPLLPAPAASPVTAATPPETGIDTLWQRYQTLHRSLPDADALPQPDRLPVPPVAVTETPAQALSTADTPAAQQARAREQARAERQQRLTALMAARHEAMQMLQRIDPEDTEAVVAALEVFDRRLTDAGVDNPLDMDTLRQHLRGVGRLNAVNAELMQEIERGAAMNPQRVQQLARELKALKAQMQQPIIDLSHLPLESHDADR